LVDSSTISFLITPIFISCGRISYPNDALKALIASEPITEEFSRFIELNKERKQLTLECFQAILNQKLHQQKVRPNIKHACAVPLNIKKEINYTQVYSQYNSVMN
jgi:hypothetical protein